MPKPAGLQVRIDVTPFIGVLLALVVVMLATTRTSTVSTMIDLPPVAICLCDYDEPVTVSVLEAGGINVNGRRSSLDTLAVDICLARPMIDCLETTVYLDASADGSYGDFAQTVDGLRAQGFRKMALVNRDFPQS